MDLIRELQGAKTVGIAGHVNPDGDAVGSAAALRLYIMKRMPGTRVDMFSEPIYGALKRLIPSSDEINTTFETDVESYDVFIAVDAGAGRLGGAEALFERAGKRLNIDHHVSSGSGSGDVNLVRAEASSTCELVYTLLEEEYIDEPIARALYIGIVTDTGVFKYSNTGTGTMRIAGELLKYGFDHTKLINEVFFGKTYVQHQILGRALLESMLIREGTCIISVLDRKTLDFYKATSSDTDGIASQLMLTEGVQCAIFMYETSPLTYRVSLRSNGKVNVAKIAAFYGGGGHERAAGCTINAPWHDIVNNISDSIEMQLYGR